MRDINTIIVINFIRHLWVFIELKLSAIIIIIILYTVFDVIFPVEIVDVRRYGEPIRFAEFNHQSIVLRKY